ncbi:aldehyde dehydrogenase family protein [Aestuariivirga sp. YIM B02566]|uniref:Aldehyde dehydrogenase family protein n=1 Tax=Taklimakanibacter albus TaxID=2800327 RepID=A0ACC5RAQ4_9HYPH|nr:aldehyde dehydrogenase family protein [Aestuariivirga sp. YIM B02566]
MQSAFANFIDGEWVAASRTVANINPSDLSDVIGHYAQGDGDQLARAIAAARRAAEAWGRTPIEQRYKALMAIGRELITRSAELGELLSREEGKPRAEGVGEVYRAGQFFEFYAAECHRQYGENAESVRPGIDVDVRREPVGVVAVISPWNFPMATASWKIAPALAYGNAVIWKPSNLTPASAWALAEIISRQNLPPGTFNLMMGSGAVIGSALVASPDIDAITLTGSRETGRVVAIACAPNLTKLQLEMGSKNALAVMDDADLDLAVAHAVNGAFFGSGQKCTASSRIIVDRKLHDAFVDRFVMAATALKVGHALDEGTQIGPVADATQLAAAEGYVALGKTAGAELSCGGARAEARTEGYYFSPTVFTGTSNDMKINREEMFVPIACVIKAEDYDHAVTIVNDTEFGLTAGIITQSLARASAFRRDVRTGCVMVNLPTAGTDYHVPFGGRKHSSHGPREQGRAAAEFYTAVKTSYINAGRAA